MAFAQVQSVQNGAVTTSLAITVSATVQNNLVILPIKIASNTVTITSVTDNVGNTYAKATGPHDSGATNRMYLYHGVQVTGGATTITVNVSGSIGVRGGASEFSGGLTTNAAVFDKAANNQGTGTSSTVTLAPANAGQLIFAGIGCSGTSAQTAGTDYTLASTPNSGYIDIYRLSGTTSETAPASWTTSSVWNEVAGAYISAEVPPPASTVYRKPSSLQNAANLISLQRL